MRLYEEPSSRLRRKLVIVGDGNIGKSALLMVQSGKDFPEEYVPTIFENFISRIQLGKKLVELSLWDTAGQEDYDRLRPLSYPDTDVVLLAYSIAEPSSYWNILEKWSPETSHFLYNVPSILVGLKLDLRDDPEIKERLRKSGSKPVSFEMGEDMMNRIRASKFFECSSKAGTGVEEIFLAAAKLSIKPRKASQKCKMI
ncbi:P-loop containing nucleoside triphosphate hydrolase protein [Polychytrium aggregatum]|uniref:P-loop containing nucleoside triphosphate hydrolase protein n=1 Tax=Polychytrium aggregatum TaxID=110093 RepID=UPI0022FE6317|nr:P-loop containing nucleoside triphosphate hydrolase protein [Polychytrium aggregatum]KAI9205867.1 P-loop containing nucleoside triphosphate hydrolase protein [Polychytrium aggregatum]